MCEALQRLLDSWNVTRRHPPEHLICLRRLLEPLATSLHYFGVYRAIDESEERLD
jgi:hypothetical protein